MSGAKLEAPFWHNRETMRGITFSRLIACAMLLILPTIRYGLRVVTLTAGVVAVCCITEIIMCLLLHLTHHRLFVWFMLSIESVQLLI